MSIGVGVNAQQAAHGLRRALRDKYAVDGKAPGFTADFIDNYYSGHTSLSSAITHSRSGNAVMTDGYGPELVVNGGFDSDSDWTKGTGWSIADGVASFSGGSGATISQTGLSLSSGKVYAVTYKVSGSNVYVTPQFSGGGGADSGPVVTTVGIKTAYIAPTINRTDFKFASLGGSSFTIDSVSVREMPVLKWAPHNLLQYSEDFSQWTLQSNVTLTPNQTDPFGGSNATLYNISASSGRAVDRSITFKSATYTFAVWVKAIVDTDVKIRRQAGSEVVTSITVAEGWQLIEADFDMSAGTGNIGFFDSSGSTGDRFYVYGAHLYRSDLGGMVDNPDQPSSRASYVPTTSSAVYLPRVGHHVYNGSAWVNEGLLAESEARTNLINNSNQANTLSINTDGALSATDSTEVASPAGSGTVIKLDKTSSGYGYARFSYPSITDTQTFSIFVKKGTARYVGLRTRNSPPTHTVFDLDTGTFVLTTGSDDRTAVDVGNGWYRLSITNSVASSSWASVAITNAGGGEANTETGTIYVFGFQRELGATPSSYIPTSTQQATREAESFTIPSANLPWPEPNILNTAWTADLSSDTDWALTGNWAVSSNALSNSGSVGYDVARYDEGPLVDGKVYELVFDINSVSGNGVRARYNGSILDTFTTTGTKKLVFVATATASEHIDFQTNGASISTSIDNISVREIDPLSVSIAMDGRMTYADEGTSQTVKFYRWFVDANNFIQPSIFTDSTRTGLMAFEQRASSTYDAVLSSNTHYSPDVLVPFDIASRHGSTFINGSVEGVALTENTTPTSLVDLSATDLSLAYDYMGTIGTFRVWDRDLGDDGIVEATNPSLEPSLSLTFEGTGTNSFVINDWSE